MSTYIELHRPDGTAVLINLDQVWAVVADPENYAGTLVSSHTGSLTVTEPYTQVRRMLGLSDTGEAPAPAGTAA